MNCACWLLIWSGVSASGTVDLVRSQDRLRTLASQLAMAEQQAQQAGDQLHDYLAQLLALGRIKLGHARQLLKSVPTGAEPLATCKTFSTAVWAIPGRSWRS